MKQLLTITILLLCFQSAQAQLTMGLTMNQQMSLTGRFTVGTGWGAAAWLQMAWNRTHSTRISSGILKLRGYNHSLEITREHLLPGNLHFYYEYTNVKRFQFWHLQASHVWQAKQRWSFELGGRFSSLSTAYGRLYKQYRITPSGGINGYSTSSNGAYSRRAHSNRDSQLRGFDIGGQVKALYRIFQGCWLEAGLYQGLVNQWVRQSFEEPRLFITSASLGMSLQVAQLKR